jgi:DNA-binding transcriptional MerR regulator
MRLKKSYSAREVAALTGLTARQLQWWDARRLFAPAVRPRRTEAGGFTERRYSPLDFFELLVLADLRKRGFSVQKLRVLLETLRTGFGVRLFDATSEGGRVRLLTNGREIYLRTESGLFFDIFRDPTQPLLEIGEEGLLRDLNSRTSVRGSGKPRSRKARRVKSDE